MMSQEIQAELEAYYTAPKLGWCIEISQGMAEIGCDRREFLEAVRAYRADEDKPNYCPTWRQLKKYMPSKFRPGMGGYTPRAAGGIMITEASIYYDFIELFLLYPATVESWDLGRARFLQSLTEKHNLPTEKYLNTFINRWLDRIVPGSNQIAAARLLLDYAQTEEEIAKAEKFLEEQKAVADKKCVPIKIDKEDPIIGDDVKAMKDVIDFPDDDIPFD